MKKETFSVGDVVRLKSGGPAMTVSSVPNTDNVHCIYFWGNERDEIAVPPGTLIKVPEQPEARDES